MQLFDVVELNQRLVWPYDQMTVQHLLNELLKPQKRCRRPTRRERDQGQAPASLQILHSGHRRELAVWRYVAHACPSAIVLRGIRDTTRAVTAVSAVRP